MTAVARGRTAKQGQAGDAAIPFPGQRLCAPRHRLPACLGLKVSLLWSAQEELSGRRPEAVASGLLGAVGRKWAGAQLCAPALGGGYFFSGCPSNGNNRGSRNPLNTQPGLTLTLAAARPCLSWLPFTPVPESIFCESKSLPVPHPQTGLNHFSGLDQLSSCRLQCPRERAGHACQPAIEVQPRRSRLVSSFQAGQVPLGENEQPY